MANKKEQPEFTVTDRRRFSDEGEPQTTPEPEQHRETEKDASRPTPVAEASPQGKPTAHEHTHDHEHEHEHLHEAERHAPPTEQERSEGQRAFKQATDALDEQLRQQVGPKAVAEEFTLSFDRVIEPFYVTAMMQLGLMGQEGSQRRVDIIGARQTIDTLSYLQEKTKGNLNQAEADLLENVLYQLRMQYLEMTNAIARSVQNPPAGGPVIPKA